MANLTLAQIMDGIDEKFERQRVRLREDMENFFENRFVRLENIIYQMGSRIGSFEDRLSTYESRLSKVESRLSNVESGK